MSWARLDKSVTGWTGGGGTGGVAPYPETVTGATLAYKFDEASGNIASVGSAALTMTATGDAATYSVTSSGLFSAISPGITMTGTCRFLNTAATAAAIGTNDFTLEYYYKSTDNTSDAGLFEMRKADLSSELYYEHRPSANIMQMRFGGTGINAQWSVTQATQSDGNIHKVRIGAVRAGSASLYFDGSLVSAQDISAAASDNVTCDSLGIGNFYNGAAAIDGTVFFFRITVGSATNNIGGPNGG